jgi:hypothetical protein
MTVRRTSSDMLNGKSLLPTCHLNYALQPEVGLGEG